MLKEWENGQFTFSFHHRQQTEKGMPNMLQVLKIGYDLTTDIDPMVLLEDTKFHDHVVPKDTRSDGASTPRFIWMFIPPFGRYLWAAFAHDFLYRTGLESRSVADAWFLLLMTEYKVPAWKRFLMWSMVRMWGWIPYNRYRKQL